MRVENRVGKSQHVYDVRDSRHHDEPGRDARLQTRNPLSYSFCESSGGFVHAEKSKRERLASEPTWPNTPIAQRAARPPKDVSDLSEEFVAHFVSVGDV